jgi:hypothetical protein
MKIIIATNIDKYKGGKFPDLSIVPRIGEHIQVKDIFVSYFKDMKLPTILQVFDVKYTESDIICEVHFRRIDLEFAKLNNINLYQ